MQRTDGMPETAYSLGLERRSSGVHVGIRDGLATGLDLAVCINISDNTIPAIQATVGLPIFRGYVSANPPGKTPHFFSGPGEALDLAHTIVESIRAARARYGKIGAIHLFIAGPAGLAFLIGQLLNTIGPVCTYEHVNEDGTGYYRRAADLLPSA
jgi:SMODS-associated and fused to various effectors sensor domain